MAWRTPPSAWADLLRLQQQLSLPDMEGVPALLGLQAQNARQDEPEAPHQEPFEPERPPPSEPEEDEAPPQDTGTLIADEQETPVYWRVESIHRKPPTPQDPPGWLGEQQQGGDMAWLMQTLGLPEAPQSLVRPSALRRQLAQHLKLGQGQRRPQLRAMLPRLARLEPLRAADWQAKRQWPGRVGLVLSLPSQMAPALADMHHAERIIKKMLGQRLHTWASKDGPHSLAPHGPRARTSLHPATEPPRPPRDGRPWIILGEVDPRGVARDAEEAADAHMPRPGPWARWAQAQAQRGPKALLLSPWPRRELAETCITAMRPITLEAPGSLPLEQGVALLRAAVYGHPGVSPNTLRHLRHALCREGVGLDAGHELGLWRDARMHAPGVTLCIVAPEHRPAVRQEFLALPPKLRWVAVEAMCLALKASQRLVRAEYVAALQAALPADAPEHDLLRQLDAEPDRAHQAMVRCLAPQGGPSDLRHFLTLTEQRAPEVLAPEDEARQALWLSLHAEDLRSGAVAAPEWADVQALKTWASYELPIELTAFRFVGGQAILRAEPNDGRVAVMVDYVQGSYTVSCEAPDIDRAIAAQLIAKPHHPATQDLWRYSQERGFPIPHMGQQSEESLKKLASRVQAALKAYPALDHLTMELNAWCSALSDSPLARLSVLFPGEAFAAEAVLSNAFHQWKPQQYWLANVDVALETSSFRAGLQSFVCPPWAEALACEGDTVCAESVSGREVVWFPGDTWACVETSNLAEPPVWRTSGAWWDRGQHAALAEGLINAYEAGESRPLASHLRWLMRPDWASSHGIDEYGWWATWQLGDAPPQRMRFIPPGEFWMGSPQAEEGRYDDETLHRVTLTQGFWLGETTVSNALWGAVTGKSTKGQATHPKVKVSWGDVHQQFLPALSRKSGHADWWLPSEAQWEYAARAGTTTAYPWGDTAEDTRMNIGGKLMPVDEGCPPNPWGLLHMHGNVWEWCQDASTGLGADHALDPLIDDRKGALRVLRGGSWLYDARYCRSAMRRGDDPGLRGGSFGVRLARGLEPARSPAEQGASQGGQKGQPEAGPPAALGRGGGVEQAPGLLDRLLGRPGKNKSS